MKKRQSWTDLLFGNVSLTVWTVILAVFGALGNGTGWRIWLIGISAGFLVLQAVVNSSRDRDILRRLARDYDRVQRRGVQVIADLGELAGRQFDLWMLDLYLKKHKWSIQNTWPLIGRDQVLERALAVSLIDVRPQPTSVERSSGPLWTSFSASRTLLWFNKATYRSATENAWDQLDDATNADLAAEYGVLSICPVVDQLDKGCIGVLAIHVKSERDAIHKALATLNSDPARRRLKEACVELHGLLAR